MLLKASCLAVVVMCLLNVQAIACSCLRHDVSTAYREFQVIFIGEVVSVSHGPHPNPDAVNPASGWEQQTVTFIVRKAWKGTRVGARIETSAIVGGGACGLDVNRYQPIGSSPDGGSRLWLIYTSHPPYNGIGLCSRSQRIGFGNLPTDEKELDRITAGIHRR